MAGNLTAMIASIFSGGVTADPYYEYTTLLLPGNGTNGAQNNTFLDGSSNNFTITRNGNTTQGTFSPFSQTGWGNYFGSSTANLKFASVASFAIGTGNFSIECFVNFTAWSGTNQRICIQGVSGTTNVQIARDSGANDLFVDIQGSRVITYAWTPTIGQWYHIAVVRSGTGSNQVALYIDGTSVATGTSSASIAQNQFLIGGLDWASGYSLQGYISNFRYSNVARTITLPTSAYTSDANTLILTCQSNRFIDNSASPKTITVNGSPSVQAFSPFNPTASWSAATNGGSGYFDGTLDYLSIASNTALTFGTGDFTVEGWFYASSFPTQPALLNIGSDAGGLVLTIAGAKIYAYFVGVGNVFGSGGSTLVTNNWYHFAWVRSGSTNTFYINGSVYGATYNSSANHSSTGGAGIGYSVAGSVFNAFAGYISNVRIVKGTAVYTSAFTPPTAPLTAITNTSLLLNFTNAGIYDATSKNDLETWGSAQISTTQSKWGGGSMYFDGTGDWLLIPDQPIQRIGTGNFTVEGWVYRNSSGTYGLIGKGTGTTGWLLSLNSSNQVVFTYGSSTITSTGTVSATTWTHIAVVREGTSTNQTKIYINGTNDGTGTVSTDFNQTNSMYVGADRTGGSAANAYMQDVRVTNYARYTANFTAPTAAFPTL